MNKIRPNYLLEFAMKNSIGNTANDFEYKLRNDKVYSLHQLKVDYTLLFFNIPDCDDCSRVKEYVASSAIINSLESEKRIAIVSIYPDEDLAAWLAEEYPNNWVNGYDEKQEIQNNELYDLKALPTFYLLDKNKKVIFKDAPIEQIDRWLNENT